MRWLSVEPTVCVTRFRSLFHIILYCDVVVGIWNDIEPLLVRLYSVPVSNEEKAFGIVKKKPSEGVLARNWLTFLMRQVISDVERLAHYATISVSKIKDKIQEKFSSEVHMGFFRSTQGNNLFSFEKVITYNSFLTQRHQNGDLYITPLFPTLGEIKLMIRFASPCGSLFTNFIKFF